MTNEGVPNRKLPNIFAGKNMSDTKKASHAYLIKKDMLGEK